MNNFFIRKQNKYKLFLKFEINLIFFDSQEALKSKLTIGRDGTVEKIMKETLYILLD